MQVRDVVVPLLALQLDGAGALETAENAGDFLIVVALDLIERFQILADALVQLHCRQRRIRTDALMQVAQDFTERQAIGVVQLRRGFDVIQHRAQRGEALWAGAAQQRVELRGDGQALLQAVMEQLLANAAGRGAVSHRLLRFIGKQHHDTAMPIKLLLQCRQQRCRRRIGDSRCLRAGLGHRLRYRLGTFVPAAGGNGQGQQQ
ncbi:hypothetical protein D3C81_921980 [compost metagenome]